MNDNESARKYRRQYLVAVAVLGGGSALTWWSLTQPWVEGQQPLLAGTSANAATTSVSIVGSQLAPAALAMAIVGIAGIAGIVGSSGLMRRIIGAVLAVAGAVIVISVVVLWLGRVPASYLPGDVEQVRALVVPIVLAIAGGVGVFCSGVLAVRAGHRWPGLGRTYERSRADGPANAWDALDKGIDPTVDAPESPR